MAIAPIDLQTLFSQVDKVGRAQLAQREGQAIQQAIHGAQLQRKTEEQIQQVNETQDTGEGIDKINERDARRNKESKNNDNKKNNSSQDNEDNDIQQIVLRDPGKGNKIDISY
jgi:type II secretory pathway pseudopilin PulG